MGFDQYHEPASELSQEIRTFAKMIASLIEEAEAINWYEQRISVEKNKQAKAIMANAQKEEFKHFGMNLEFLLQYKKDWRIELQGILFKEGDIVDSVVTTIERRYAYEPTVLERVLLSISSNWARRRKRMLTDLSKIPRT